MIATIITPLNMPPLADSNDTTTTTAYGHSISSYTLPSRSSGDKARFGGEHADRASNGDAPTMNGKLANGSAMPSIPNGRLVADKRPSQTDGAAPAQKAWPLSTQTPPSVPEGRSRSGELQRRDDGYFASIHSSETTDSGGTTHVKLGAVSPLDGIKEASKDFLPPSKHESNASGSQPSNQQNNLQIPNSTRVSSPPAFNHTNPNPPEQPHRLQHRHTLEVPKASAARPRDHPNNTDDVVTASGRFSPNTPTRRRGSMSLARRATRSIHSDMHLEEVPQDEDAARWAEHIRQKRASKRKRKEDEDDDRVVVGTKVDQNHVNWVTAYNMLTGIRFTVSRTNAKMDRELTDADFEAKHKFSFDMYVPDNFSFSNFLPAFNVSCGGSSRGLCVSTWLTDWQNRKRADSIREVRLQVQGLCTLGLPSPSYHLRAGSGRLSCLAYQQIHPFRARISR